MAVNMTFLIHVILIFSIISVQAQNETTVTPETPTTLAPTKPVPQGSPSLLQRNTDVAECTCDLTGNSCDVECCCDKDCAAEDIQAFSRCIDEYTAADSQTCLKSSIIFKENVPYAIDESVSGLFCIITDNYEERNFYEIPEIVSTSEVFDSYLNSYGGPSYKLSSTTLEVPVDYYRSGDPVLTVYENLALGILGLPTSVNSQTCVDTNPTAYLKDESHECVRPISDLAAECTQNPSLDANTYFLNFKVVSSPVIFADLIPDNETGEATTVDPGFSDGVRKVTELVTDAPSTVGSTEVPPLYNSSALLDILPNPPHICTDINGLNMTCDFTTDIPSPTYVLDEDTGLFYCHNVVVKVEYTLQHNGTEGVSATGVRFTMADINQAALPLTQAFSTQFIKEGSVGDEFERSGNPGYQVGEPLMAGTLVTYEEVDTTETLHSIELDSDNNNWLTMVTGTAMGDCITDINSRIPVTFDEDMRSGCNIRVNFENMTEACQLIQDAATNALLGPNPRSYVATFGNSAVENVGDWVPILYENEPTGAAPSRTQPGVCDSVVLGMHIEVLYANVGALGNPQPKVIGVAFRFDDPQEIRFQCIGPYCQPGTEGSLRQSFEVVSSVGFVDASQPSVAVTAERPRFTAKLPADFFYPFS